MTKDFSSFRGYGPLLQKWHNLGMQCLLLYPDDHLFSLGFNVDGEMQAIEITRPDALRGDLSGDNIDQAALARTLCARAMHNKTGLSYDGLNDVLGLSDQAFEDTIKNLKKKANEDFIPGRDRKTVERRTLIEGLIGDIKQFRKQVKRAESAYTGDKKVPKRQPPSPTATRPKRATRPKPDRKPKLRPATLSEAALKKMAAKRYALTADEETGNITSVIQGETVTISAEQLLQLEVMDGYREAREIWEHYCVSTLVMYHVEFDARKHCPMEIDVFVNDPDNWKMMQRYCKDIIGFGPKDFPFLILGMDDAEFKACEAQSLKRCTTGQNNFAFNTPQQFVWHAFPQVTKMRDAFASRRRLTATPPNQVASGEEAVAEGKVMSTGATAARDKQQDGNER